jgi:hypothetical protein
MLSYPALPGHYAMTLVSALQQRSKCLIFFGGARGWRYAQHGGMSAQFRVGIKEEALTRARESVFDPSESFAFETKERAQSWCDNVNRRLGYERFYVIDDAHETERHRQQKCGT